MFNRCSVWEALLAVTDIAWLNLAAWTASGTMLAPTAIVCGELFAALFPSRSPVVSADVVRARVAVLIPAHNESAMIAQTVTALLPQLRERDRIVVVADNCSDDTASLARTAGALAIERFDTARRGKGYALDFGVRFLEQDPPDVVIVVDADVTVRSGSIEALTRTVQRTGRPAQSVYVLRSPDGASVKDQLSHIAFAVRNQIRAIGLMRLTGVCPLFGAGMAFPWQTLAKAPLASGNIVEDLALSLDLASAGQAPVLCPEARVDGTLVAIRHDGDLAQRRRWEHGHMRTMTNHAPRVLLRGIARGNFRAAALATDVMVPPLSLKVTCTLMMIGALLLAGVLGAGFAPALALIGSQVALGGLIAWTWSRYADCTHPLRPLLSVPAYVLGKLPLYTSFLTCAEKVWHRAARPASTPAVVVEAPKRAA